MNSLAAARALAPELALRAPEIERARRLPPDVVAMIAGAGLFRIMLPSSLGGAECPAAEALAVIEAIGRADASCAWCVMIAATTSLVAAYLPEEAARSIHSRPDVVTGGVFAPIGRAQPAGAGFRLDGHWQWASGSSHCDWLGGGCVVLDDGKPRRLPDGSPDTRMMFFPASSARLVDSWHVSGLCGTGSGEMLVDGLCVPADYAVSLATDQPRETGPLYRFPVFGLLALGVAAVMLGNARAAIDDLVALAAGKTPQGSRRTLAERSGAQAALAQSEATLAAARAYFYDSVHDAWRLALAGDPIEATIRARLRLAATHASRSAADVVRAMYELGGGSSIFESNPLQRRFRDAHVGTQHMMVAPPTLELAGRVLMGLPTDARLL